MKNKDQPKGWLSKLKKQVLPHWPYLTTLLLNLVIPSTTKVELEIPKDTEKPMIIRLEIHKGGALDE